jgi:hypothetical protein
MLILRRIDGGVELREISEASERVGESYLYFFLSFN